MPVDWKKALGSLVKHAPLIVKHVPVVRDALSATIQELEKNPQYVAFVTKYQQMNPDAECVICMAHRYCASLGVTASDVPPPHVCQDIKR